MTNAKKLVAGAAKNTDRELFREKSNAPSDPGNYYTSSCHVTKDGALGINVGGFVRVMPLRDWHALGKALEESQYHYDCCGEEIATLRNALEAAERLTPEERLTQIVIENDIRKEERTRIVKLLELRARKNDADGEAQGQGAQNAMCGWAAEELRYVALQLTLADEIEGKDD